MHYIILAFGSALTSVTLISSQDTTCTSTDAACTGVINPCLNAGKCCIQNGGPVCDCQATEGYSGGFCHERPCLPNTEPCLNGGTCETSNGKYYCRCLPEFTGPKCEVAPCASGPCQNGGTCLAAKGTYHCSCPKNTDDPALTFGGRDCEFTPCSPNPCLNGGVCQVTSRRHTGKYHYCQCPDGFYGPSCEETNPCETNPCENGASCFPTKQFDWGYYCNPVNATEWFGVNAELPSPCVTGNYTCENGAECERHGYFDYPDKYHCKCSDEWFCNKCDSPNPCVQGLIEMTGNGTPIVTKSASELCHNGGTCYPYCIIGSYTNGYSCRCPFGYTGRDCTIRYAKRAHCCGDPRCFSFDGNPFNYHGTCHAVLSKTCNDETWPVEIPTFQIVGNFRRCSPQGLTCTNGVSVEIDGQIIEILIDQKAYIDGQEATLPYHLPNPENPQGEPLLTIQVDPHDPLTTLAIETSSGLYITQNRRCLEVHLSHELYQNITGKICGLFGNADNEPENDNAGLENQQDFFASNILRPEKPSGCSISEKDLAIGKRRKRQASNFTISTCADETQKKEAYNACSIISDTSGPFRPCYYKMGSERIRPMMENCMEDYCVDKSFKCDNLEGFAKACGSMTRYEEWRKVARCQINCPEGMTYSLQAHRYCTKTCFDPDPCPLSMINIDHDQTNDEGCMCNSGTIWDVKSGSCVKAADCGKTVWSLPDGFKTCRQEGDASNSSLPLCDNQIQTTSADGFVVVAWSNQTTPYSSNIYAYNVVSGVWSAVPDRASSTERDTFLTTCQDNLYLVSGFTGRRVVKTDKKSAIPTSAGQSAALLKQKGYGVTVVSMGNSTYLVGGESDNYGMVSIDCEGKWKQLHNSTYPHYFSSGAALNGKVYVCGSLFYKASPVCEAYNPSTNTWEELPPMNIARTGLGAVAMNGQLYVVGGSESENERFDPDSRQWVFYRALPKPTYLAGVTTDGSRIFVAGGRNEKGDEFYNTLNIYIPHLDVWVTEEVVKALGAIPSATFVRQLPTPELAAQCQPLSDTCQNPTNNACKQIPDKQVMVNYMMDPMISMKTENSDVTMSMYGSGLIENCTGTGTFILSGQVTFNTGDAQTAHSVCIEGTLEMEGKTWKAKGSGGNRSFDASGQFTIQEYESDYPSMTISPKTSAWSVMANPPPYPVVCGNFHNSTTTESSAESYSYTWQTSSGGLAMQDQVHWSGDGSKYEGGDYSRISGSAMTGEYFVGCLTSLMINATNGSFVGKGHINGRKFVASGRVLGGMFIVDQFSLNSKSGMVGTYTSVEENMAGTFTTQVSHDMGTVFENYTWTTTPESWQQTLNSVSGSYKDGRFEGSGKVDYLDVSVKGDYGALCYVTDPIDEVTCPNDAPKPFDFGTFLLSDGAFYLCGSIAEDSGKTGTVEGNGWIYTHDVEHSDLMEFDAQPIELEANYEISNQWFSSDHTQNTVSPNITLAVRDSEGKTIIAYSGEISLGMDSNVFYGSIYGDSLAVDFHQGRMIGDKFVLIGMIQSLADGEHGN